MNVVSRPDGAEIHAVTLGPEEAPVLVLVNGAYGQRALRIAGIAGRASGPNSPRA